MSKLAEGTKLAKAAKIKIGVAAGVAAAAVATVAAVLLGGEESYRTVAVEEVNGTALVSGEDKEAQNAFAGMHLYSGDDVSVQQESDMTMVLDMDKYVYAEPGTHFWLECEGTADDSRTLICMDAGSVLNHIKTNLNEGEVYQVDTPNSTMAVRGTVFRVTVYRGEDGLVYTLLEVFEGRVQVDLKTETGEYNGVSETFEPGEGALIRGNSEFSEFVRDDELDWIETDTGTVKLPIAYKKLPPETAEILVDFIEEGRELCIGKELLMDYTQLTEHRLITREGKEPTCTETGYEEVWCEVCNEVTETRELPLLEHEPGEWEVTLEPTCENPGSRQRVCRVCGTVCETEELKELGHQEGGLLTLRNATCTEAGEQVRRCTVCGKELQRAAISALGHTTGAAVTVASADCTDEGLTQTKCSVCGVVISEETTPATGHDWGSWHTVSPATCTAQGTEERECSDCGSTETDTIAATGHSMSWSVDTPATCNASGLEIGVCSVCKATENRTIEQTAHTYVYKHGSLIKGNNGGYQVTCSASCTGCGEDIPQQERTVSEVEGRFYCECGEEVQ